MLEDSGAFCFGGPKRSCLTSTFLSSVGLDSPELKVFIKSNPHLPFEDRVLFPHELEECHSEDRSRTGNTFSQNQILMIVNPILVACHPSSKAWGFAINLVPGQLGAKEVTGVCLPAVGGIRVSDRGEASDESSLSQIEHTTNLEN
jgi:hypothetical protein